MHYYQFNIGDYKSHTSHLTESEDLAYRRMLDWAYLHEKPLPKEIDEIARLIRMRTHSDCIATVLREFWQEVEDGYINERVQRELDKIGEKSSKARASARARWDANAMRTQCEGNATQDTRHITQDTSNKGANAPMAATTLPPCPQQDLLNLYRKHLPNLTQPRIWDGSRAASLRQRWQQCARPSAGAFGGGYETTEKGIEFWDSFFGYIANDTTLAKGFESQGRVWRPDLEWICKPANFAKIVDGKYAK